MKLGPQNSGNIGEVLFFREIIKGRHPVAHFSLSIYLQITIEALKSQNACVQVSMYVNPTRCKKIAH
jgi:hypothetical protein